MDQLRRGTYEEGATVRSGKEDGDPDTDFPTVLVEAIHVANESWRCERSQRASRHGDKNSGSLKPIVWPAVRNTLVRGRMT